MLHGGKAGSFVARGFCGCGRRAEWYEGRMDALLTLVPPETLALCFGIALFAGTI